MFICIICSLFCSTQVFLAKKNSDYAWLFVNVLAPLLNFVGGSQNRKEFLWQKQAQRVVDALSLGELKAESGLKQQCGLGRPCDTRRGSHFKTILNVLNLYPTILEWLDTIGEVSDTPDKNKAQSFTHLLMSFHFIFVAYMMVRIFGIVNELNVVLQKHNQDIVNAIVMVDVTKKNMQKIRDSGWDSHTEKVTSFMFRYDIEIPDMEVRYHVSGKRMYRDNGPKVTKLHHFDLLFF